MARWSGILQRKRGIRSVPVLLKILFLYASSKFSFRILAAAVYALGISSISDTAWRKHLTKAVPFLHELLHTMLSCLLTRPDITAFQGVKNILLVDASVIRHEGKRQEPQRVHLCDSLNHNRMKQVKVTDQHTAESLTHFVLEKGDLVMADAGYGTAQNFIYAQKQGADVILRITPATFCLYDADGEKSSLIELLKNAEKKRMEWVEISGFCKYKNKSGFVRIIAQRLPEKQAEKARKRKKGNASRKQRRFTARKAGSITYAEAVTLLWLILWAITKQQTFLAECFLSEKQEKAYSIYEECKIAFLQITQILDLSWSLFIDLKEERYTRFFSKKKRWRINQNDEFHLAVLPGLFA